MIDNKALQRYCLWLYSLLGNIGDVFATDILYHKNCMCSFILKFDHKVNELINSNNTVFDNSTEDVFNRVITNLDVCNKAHYVLNVQDIVNQEFEKSSIGKILFSLFFLSFCLFVWPPHFKKSWQFPPTFILLDPLPAIRYTQYTTE